jgi:hypothetical protein
MIRIGFSRGFIYTQLNNYVDTYSNDIVSEYIALRAAPRSDDDDDVDDDIKTTEKKLLDAQIKPKEVPHKQLNKNNGNRSRRNDDDEREKIISSALKQLIDGNNASTFDDEQKLDSFKLAVHANFYTIFLSYTRNHLPNYREYTEENVLQQIHILSVYLCYKIGEKTGIPKLALISIVQSVFWGMAFLFSSRVAVVFRKAVKGTIMSPPRNKIVEGYIDCR